VRGVGLEEVRSMGSFDGRRLKELMLYVSERLFDDPSFGAVKLNKVLYFSDFIAYSSLGHSITGATYQKLKNGPAARQLLPAQHELQTEHAAELVESAYFGGFTQKRLIPQRKAELSSFSADEIALVDEVIEDLRGRSASEVSDLSHRAVGWQIAEIGEDIPYETALLSDDPLTMEDVERARELASEHGWLDAQP
jgi:hypothetical protein